MWAALVTAGALGLWCEKNTKLGRELSGCALWVGRDAPLVHMAGMAAVLPLHRKRPATVCTNRRALVATLLGMAMANLGVLPSHPPELNVVYKFILPLAIPMLLFSADLA